MDKELLPDEHLIDEIPIRLPAPVYQIPTDVHQCGDDNRIGILPAEHPLLERFQKTLNEHLLRVKNELTNQISNINLKINEKEKERENVGEKLYDMQQDIKRQNHQLEEYSKQIDEINQKRTDEDTNLIPLKTNYDDKYLHLKDIKRNYNERLMELSRLQLLESNINKWSDNIDDEVITAKRTVSKDYKSQQELSEMKKLTDMLLHNIDSSVRAREHELNGINNQIDDEKKLLNATNVSYTNASSDLEALQQEHKRLTQAWSEVIISIEHRDKILFESKVYLEKIHENIKLTCASIEGTRKASSKEMEQNERLEAFKRRIGEDLKNFTAQTEKETDNLQKLENQHETLTNLIDQTEQDYNNAKHEFNSLNVHLQRIKKQLDKIFQEKFHLEETLLTLAQDQLTTDKASEYRMKILRDSQEQRRKLEINLSKSENVVSQTLLDIEKWKGIVIRLKDDNKVMMQKLDEKNSEVDAIKLLLKNLDQEINKNMKSVQRATRKLDEMLIATKGREISPTELKIFELEREIEETTGLIREQQQFWLTMQGRVVNITEKRANAMNILQIARKQMMIITQKSLRVDHQLEDTEKKGVEIKKNIRGLVSKLEILGNKLFEKQRNHQLDEGDCEMVHMVLIENLKKSEMSVLEIEQDIFDITKTNEFEKDLVLQKHREALSWESKYKLIEETLRWLKGEKALESEIGVMKSEIHRMDIRHQQLKRAQEKLIQDLEHCVMHRDKIFDVAQANHKIDGNQSRSRSTIQQKLNELKNKLKLSQIEYSINDRNLNDKHSQCQFIVKEIYQKQEELDHERGQDLLVMSEIEQGMLLKYQNLENIVRKQQRAKRYRCLSCMPTQPKHLKSETTLDTQTQKQKEINDNLSEIVQNLLNEYPQKKFFLTRIMQTLRDD